MATAVEIKPVTGTGTLDAAKAALALKTLKSVAVKGSYSCPCLDYVLIEQVRPDVVTLTATDLKVGIRLEVPGTVTEPLLLHRAMLHMACETVAPGFMLFLVDGTASYMDAKASGGFTSTVSRLDAEEFPIITSFGFTPLWSTSAVALSRVLERALKSAGTDTSNRSVLANVYFDGVGGAAEATNKFTIVSTDGYAMGVETLEVGALLDARSFLLPSAAVTPLLRALAHAHSASFSIQPPGGQICVSDAGVEVFCTLRSELFPQYVRHIPLGTQLLATFDGPEFRRVLIQLKKVTPRLADWAPLPNVLRVEAIEGGPVTLTAVVDGRRTALRVPKSVGLSTGRIAFQINHLLRVAETAGKGTATLATPTCVDQPGSRWSFSAHALTHVLMPHSVSEEQW